jgi:ubiquinone/menaquinone biosynthesis C-methylase UbiE
LKILTLDDFRDMYLRTVQRGIDYILSKTSIRGIDRTKSTFDDTQRQSAHFWIIPEVIHRRNRMITGDPLKSYETFLSENYLRVLPEFRLLSIGSGECMHELSLARLNPHGQVTCIDIAESLLTKAEKEAVGEGLSNIAFITGDVRKYDFSGKRFDIVLFNDSLHHFDNMEQFIGGMVKRLLKPAGKLVVHEYVGPNRFQYGKEQCRAVNECIGILDENQRVLFRTNLRKKRFYGVGVLRMLLADPSECVDSASILPVIHRHFRVVVERPLGGNLLMGALKDVSHHFMNKSEESERILEKLFEYEDAYLKTHGSDFIFGIYEKRE